MTIHPSEVRFILHDPRTDIIIVSLFSGVDVIFPHRGNVPVFILGYCSHDPPDIKKQDGCLGWTYKRFKG